MNGPTGVDFNYYVGKTVIVGFDYLDTDGKQYDADEFWGKVIRSSAKEGILIRNPNTGEEWNSPPSALKPLKPGMYKLKSTGEELIDPDFELIWDIQDPAGTKPGSGHGSKSRRYNWK